MAPPRPNNQRKNYKKMLIERRKSLKKMRDKVARMKMHDQKPFRIRADEFIRNYAASIRGETTLSAWRKMVWEKLYEHVAENWSPSEFEKNLLTQELTKRMRWQQFYDSVLLENKIPHRMLTTFLETGYSTLEKAETLCKALPLKDSVIKLKGLQTLTKAAIGAIRKLKVDATHNNVRVIPPMLVQTVFVAHLLILQRQFGKEFTTQLKEAEDKIMQWAMNQR